MNKKSLTVLVDEEEQEFVERKLKNKCSLKSIAGTSGLFGTLMGLGHAIGTKLGYLGSPELQDSSFEKILSYSLLAAAIWGTCYFIPMGSAELISRARTIGKIKYNDNLEAKK